MAHSAALASIAFKGVQRLLRLCLAGEAGPAPRGMTAREMALYLARAGEADALGAFLRSQRQCLPRDVAALPLLHAASEEGHLAVAQLVAAHYGLTGDYLRALRSNALGRACANGHLALAQWLADHFALTPADAAAEKGYTLRAARENGHADTALWLRRRFGSVTVVAAIETALALEPHYDIAVPPVARGAERHAAIGLHVGAGEAKPADEPPRDGEVAALAGELEPVLDVKPETPDVPRQCPLSGQTETEGEPAGDGQMAVRARLFERALGRARDPEAGDEPFGGGPLPPGAGDPDRGAYVEGYRGELGEGREPPRDGKVPAPARPP